MAEFCLDCWNKIRGVKDSPEKYLLSRHPDLCEACGEWKPVIIRAKQRHAFAKNKQPISEAKERGKQRIL